MLKLIDFSAKWCPPCQMMSPVVEEIKEEMESSHSGDFTVEMVDVDEDQVQASQFGIMSIPTFVLVKDDQEIDRKTGVMTKDELVSWISDNLS